MNDNPMPQRFEVLAPAGAGKPPGCGTRGGRRRVFGGVCIQRQCKRLNFDGQALKGGRVLLCARVKVYLALNTLLQENEPVACVRVVAIRLYPSGGCGVAGYGPFSWRRVRAGDAIMRPIRMMSLHTPAGVRAAYASEWPAWCSPGKCRFVKSPSRSHLVRWNWRRLFTEALVCPFPDSAIFPCWARAAVTGIVRAQSPPSAVFPRGEPGTTSA